MTKFEDIFDFQDKYKYLAHIKDNREETLQEHTELANKYFEKIVEYKNLKPFFEGIKNILNLENQEEELYYKMIDDVVNFHDFGKINSQFQIDKMLNEEILKMEDKYNISGVLASDHSLLSANMFIAYYFEKITALIETVETKKIVILLEILFALSYTISKHHGNLDSFEEYIEKLSRNNEENILKELKNIREIRDLGVSLIHEDRMTYGVSVKMPIYENIMADQYYSRKYCSNGLINIKKEKEVVNI